MKEIVSVRHVLITTTSDRLFGFRDIIRQLYQNEDSFRHFFVAESATKALQKMFASKVSFPPLSGHHSVLLMITRRGHHLRFDVAHR